MTDAEKQALAVKILELYRATPTTTLPDVAIALGEDSGIIAEIIDSYQIGADAVPIFAGQGQGGGWIPESIRETLVTGFDVDPESMGDHIGYRWPDGSLRETPFDPEAQ